MPGSAPQPGGHPPPPPAASVVATAARTEGEIKLETELESERKARKERELQICEMQDELHRLKTPAKPKKGCLEAFLDGED